MLQCFIIIDPNKKNHLTMIIILDFCIINTYLLESIFLSREHLGAVLCLTVTPDDAIVFSGSDDTTIVEFSVLSGKRIGVLKGHSKAVTALKLNSNVDLLASGIKIFSLHECSFFV